MQREAKTLAQELAEVASLERSKALVLSVQRAQDDYQTSYLATIRRQASLGENGVTLDTDCCVVEYRNEIRRLLESDGFKVSIRQGNLEVGW